MLWWVISYFLLCIFAILSINSLSRIQPYIGQTCWTLCRHLIVLLDDLTWEFLKNPLSSSTQMKAYGPVLSININIIKTGTQHKVSTVIRLHTSPIFCGKILNQEHMILSGMISWLWHNDSFVCSYFVLSLVVDDRNASSANSILCSHVAVR